MSGRIARSCWQPRSFVHAAIGQAWEECTPQSTSDILTASGKQIRGQKKLDEPEAPSQRKHDVGRRTFGTNLQPNLESLDNEVKQNPSMSRLLFDAKEQGRTDATVLHGAPRGREPSTPGCFANGTVS